MTLNFIKNKTIILINDPKKGHFLPPSFSKKVKRSFFTSQKRSLLRGGGCIFLKNLNRNQKNFFQLFNFCTFFLINFEYLIIKVHSMIYFLNALLHSTIVLLFSFFLQLIVSFWIEPYIYLL